MAVYDFKPKKRGSVGRKAKLTPSLRGERVKTIEKCALTLRALTAETPFSELEKLQTSVRLRVARSRLRRMSAFWRRLRLKPHLNDEHRVKRVE